MNSQPKLLHSALFVDYSKKQQVIQTDCLISNSLIPTVEAINTIAIWDTGATNTAISPTLSSKLELPPIGVVPVRGVHGLETVNRCIVDLSLSNKVTFRKWEVLELSISDQAGVLIGMDIIGAGDFSICGGQFFSYALPPFDNPINLVEKTSKVNERINRHNKKVQRQNMKK